MTSAVPSRESAGARRERARRIAAELAETYPEADCELHYENPWQLLVATILSAQSTDAMVNQVTPALFDAFPTPRALGSAEIGRLETLVRRTGYFRQKAKAVRECSKRIARDHGGEVPADMEALTALPGVGRKTASVVLGTAFGVPAVFVDTHVKRLSGRLALSGGNDPEKVEKDLKRLIPEAEWTAFSHRLIHHGRQVCHARKPACVGCAVAPICPQKGVKSVTRSFDRTTRRP